MKLTRSSSDCVLQLLHISDNFCVVIQSALVQHFYLPFNKLRGWHPQHFIVSDGGQVLKTTIAHAVKHFALGSRVSNETAIKSGLLQLGYNLQLVEITCNKFFCVR